MNNVLGFLAPTVICLIVFVLNAILPGKWYVGYAIKTDSDKKLNYRLNGLLVALVTIGIWAGLCYWKLLEWDWLYTVRWYSLVGACVLGIIFSLLIVIKHKPVTTSFWRDFFLGRAENIQIWGGRIDAKMWLYLVGTIMLELNIVSFSAHHYIRFGNDASIGFFLSSALLTFFVFDYLIFERIHLYTYDLFAERVGYKLGWGCIAFYPYFYIISLWSTVNVISEIPYWLLTMAIVIFLSGWGMSRGANMQKYFFKKDPGLPFLGIKPNFITDGKRKLLINGYWGLSRHINYLGEIFMAIGIVLATGQYTKLLPWLYPLYYVILLFPRQLDDDKRCTLKYGDLWKDYQRKVPYKIIPFLY